MTSVDAQLEGIVRWYARTAYGRWEGPGCVPFYCDAERIGSFAVRPAALARGEDVVLVIDVQGARQVRTRGIETVGIFVLPPSSGALEQRLRGRSKDSEDQIRRRLEVARREVAEYAQYEYVVINDEVEAAVERLRAIVQAERARVRVMRPVAEAIKETF